MAPEEVLLTVLLRGSDFFCLWRLFWLRRKGLTWVLLQNSGGLWFYRNRGRFLWAIILLHSNFQDWWLSISVLFWCGWWSYLIIFLWVKGDFYVHAFSEMDEFGCSAGQVLCDLSLRLKVVWIFFCWSGGLLRLGWFRRGGQIDADLFWGRRSDRPEGREI